MKSSFVDNTVNTSAQQGKGIVVDKVFDLIGAKVANGDIVALLVGDQYTDMYENNEYVEHKVAIFDSSCMPISVEFLVKSSHSFAHYGECTEEMPRVGTRTSANEHLVPDMDMQNVSSPFRFKAVTIGQDDKGKALINLRVEHLQFFKVDGFKRYWTAVYDQNKNVIVVDGKDESGMDIQYCKMKATRKPNFVALKPTAAQLKKLTEALANSGLSAAVTE